ncbi:MAG: hypothetical protein JXB26_00815 [Candidatus Aminicenantes bacterium]|nr:hypothetical protein [Candidatus Aminicenantes bacterium]
MNNLNKIKATIICAGIFLFCFSHLSECAEEKLKVIVDKAYIYLKPDVESKILASVDKGTLLSYKGRPGARRRWYYVYFSPGKKNVTLGGYIQSFCVELSEEIEVPKKEHSEKRKTYFSPPIDIRIVQSDAKIYIQPDFSSLQLKDIKIGALLKAFRKEGAWYYVELPSIKDGYKIMGYIHQQYVEKIEEMPVEHPEKEASDKYKGTQQKLPVPELSPTVAAQPTHKREKITSKEFYEERNMHLGIGVSFFAPSGNSIKNTYGSRPDIDADFSMKIWKGLELFVRGNFSWDRGELSYTKEETKMNIYRIGFGVNYRIYKGYFSLYAGVCPMYFQISEKNPIGDINEGQLGFLGKIGSCLYINRIMFFSVHAGYSYAKESSTDISVNIGGIELGAHIGIIF